MSPLVYIVMFGWIPFVVYLFRWVPPQRAVVVSFIIAWLFLPQAKFVLPGIPDYTKMSATCYGIFLATVIFDVKRFSSFRLAWLDLPMLVWCLCPIASSITNGLGLYDGISSSLDEIVSWGLPYYLGRLYLNSLDGLRKLAIDIFIGGLLYIPLCLIELRISPQLHMIFYGFHAREDLSQTVRYGGFRPTVFMEHGLMVGAWMMAATLIGVWLWHTGTIGQIWGIRARWLVAVLLITFLMLRSTGAWFLLFGGLVILFSAKWFRSSLVLYLLIAAISSYLFLGVTGRFASEPVVSVVSQTINPERAQSVQFRFDNEKLLSAKARQKMLFGWGGWGRSRVYDEFREDKAVTDSLWIIAFGTKGLVGLISLVASLLLPTVAFVRSFPANTWDSRQVAPLAALAVLLVLYMVDCLLNAMLNPIYILACGGVAGVALNQSKGATRVRRDRRQVSIY